MPVSIALLPPPGGCCF